MDSRVNPYHNPPARPPRLWRRLTRKAWRRPAAASGALLMACVLTTPLRADTINWVDGNSDWHASPANWSLNRFPVATDDVQNNTASTITHSNSNDTINSFLSAGAFVLNGGSLNANTATSTFAVNNTFTLDGGTLNGFLVGGNGITVTGSNGNRLNGVTINSVLDMSTNPNAFVQVDGGNLTVNGTVNLANGGRLRANNDETFGGTGSIVFGSAGASGIIDNVNGTLTVGNGLTVRGQNGTINANLVNAGTISADVAGGTITSVLGFSSSGTVQAVNGGTLTINGDVTSSGAVRTGANSQVNMNSLTQTAGVTQSSGTLNLNAGSGTLTANGGLVQGTGTIAGSVVLNSGATLSPGVTNGALTITGAYTQNNGGMFLEQIGGALPGSQYTQLNVNGLATLGSGSILDVTFANGFAATVGEQFDIFNYGSLNGTFGSIISGTPGYTFSFFDNGSGHNGILQVLSAPAASPPTNVPEPGAWGLLGATLMSGFAFSRRRRARA